MVVSRIGFLTTPKRSSHIPSKNTCPWTISRALPSVRRLYRVEHDTILDFNVLVNRFRHVILRDVLPKVHKPSGGTSASADASASAGSGYRFSDAAIAAKWADFHRRNAKLQLLCASCNLTKKANPTELLCA